MQRVYKADTRKQKFIIIHLRADGEVNVYLIFYNYSSALLPRAQGVALSAALAGSAPPRRRRRLFQVFQGITLSRTWQELIIKGPAKLLRSFTGRAGLAKFQVGC
ncbi:hypothetical protein EVAR_97836_1 [Eumeta japonica]|uniref:Uncharacterized protein n=1 Tax=Eumeta variegata TaxID=151549 RepID=A0A4C2AGV1_EUMVA|nr:hypothetical protein EVAR_97836_1 [Eumeta japonica]